MGTGVECFCSLYLNQPFSAPPECSLDEQQHRSQSMLNTMGDHLWLLQTDTGYMRRYCKQLEAGSIGEHVGDNWKYVFISGHLMRDAVRYWQWEGVQEEVGLIRQKLLPKPPFGNNSTASILKGYQDSLRALEVLLIDHIRRLSLQFHFVYASRPGFKTAYNFSYKKLSRKSALSFRRRDGEDQSFPKLFSKDILEFCLYALVMDSHLCYEVRLKMAPRHDPAMLFTMLDEYLEECHRIGRKEELARIDDVLFSYVTELSTLYQVLGNLRLHKPHPGRSKVEKIASFVPPEDGKIWRYIKRQFFEHQIMALYYKLDPQGNLVLEGLPENEEDGQHKHDEEKKLADLLESFLHTPQARGPRSAQDWLDKDTIERKTLSKFWEGIRARYTYTLNRLGFDVSDIESNLRILSADSDPEYLAELEAERKAILAEIAAREAEKETKKLLKTQGRKGLQTQWGQEQQDSLDVSLAKLKVKTHGTTDQVTNNTEHSISDTEKDIGQPIRVAVSKKSLAIFKAMFPGRNSEDRSRTVEWDAFVNAMGEEPISFIARHNAGGAAYSFEPSEKSMWHGKGKIVFHKPHPETVLDPVELSTNGKRMAKWFGWSEETFRLREK